MNKVRDAAEDFLDALSNTNSRVRVTQFGTLSEKLAPSTVVDDNTLGAGGVLRDAINGYYNPRPPRPNDVEHLPVQRRLQRNKAAATTSTPTGTSPRQAAETSQYLVVYITDGDPTAYDFDKPGTRATRARRPTSGSAPTGSAAQVTLDRAVEEANRLKTTGFADARGRCRQRPEQQQSQGGW